MDFRNTNFHFSPGLDKEHYPQLLKILSNAGVKWFDNMGLNSKNLFIDKETYEYFIVDDNNKLQAISDFREFKNKYPGSRLISTMGTNKTVDGWDFLNVGNLDMDDVFGSLNEDSSFLNKKYIIFDDEATRQDIIDTYNILVKMGVTPLSVLRGLRYSIDYWIYEFVGEIEEFIDRYGGAYFRVWITSYDKKLTLDYGATSRNDLDIDNVDDSELIYFKELLDIRDIDFFPENLNESSKDENPKVGDYLYCHTDMIMVNGTKEHTKGEIYKIENIIPSDNELMVIDNSGDEHYYEMSPTSASYYRKWFHLLDTRDEIFDSAFEPLV